MILDHVAIVNQGKEAIAKWRNENPGITLDLSMASLSGADLNGANLNAADLSGAILRGANVIGAILSEAILSEANLSYADLSGADLRGADLREANLSHADLSGADLRGADLREANLSAASLRFASGFQHVRIGPIGSRNDTLLYIWTPEWEQVQAGCWFGTLDEFQERVKSVYADSPHGMNYQRAIKALRVLRED